jgi:hypothetical protein
VGLAAFSKDFESAVFFVRQEVAFQFYLIEKHKKKPVLHHTFWLLCTFL